MKKATKLLVTYHSNDGRWKGHFYDHCKPYRDNGELDVTYDEIDSGGDRVNPMAVETIESIDVVFILISKDFLTLTKIGDVSIEAFVRSFDAQATKVILVHAEHCEWSAHDWIIEKGLKPSNSGALSDDKDNPRTLNRHVSKLVQDALSWERNSIDSKSMGEQQFRGTAKRVAKKKRSIHSEVILYKDEGIEVDTDGLVANLNSICKYVSFSKGESTLAINDDVINRPRTHTSVKPSLMNNISNRRHIVFTERRYDNYYFYDTHEDITIVSFYEWKSLTHLPLNNGASFFIAAIIALEIDSSVRHAEVTGCVYDYLTEKTGVDKGMRDGRVCSSCLNRIQPNVSGELKLLFDDLQTILNSISQASGQGIDVLDLLAHNSAESKGDTDVGLFEKYYYLLAPTSKMIVDAAIEMSQDKWGAGGVCTASYLLFVMVERGKSRARELNTARFFRESVLAASSLDAFVSIRDAFFEEIRKRGARYPRRCVHTSSGNVSSSTVGILGLAAKYASETTKDQVIQVRHLLVAMLFYRSSNGKSGVRDRLNDLGLNVEEVLTGFPDHLKLHKHEHEAWTRILQNAGDESGGEAGDISQRIAGVSNDNVVDDDGPLLDQLGIEGEVNALSAVIAAKGTEPPLSIGLFGDWGSGKSFFMCKMRQRIRAIAEESERCVKNNEESYFCRNVVQIPFNAWHYMDANLWASLVTHIFDKLAEHLAGDKKQTVEETKRELVEKVKSAKEMLESAKEKEKEATKTLASAESKLKSSEEQVSRKRKKVTDLAPREMAEQVMNNPKVKVKIEGACEAAGLDRLPTTIDELEQTVEDICSIVGRAGRFWNSLGQGKKQKGVWILLLIVFTAIPAGIAWLLTAGFAEELQRVGTMLVGGIVGVVSWIRPKLKMLDEGLFELERARDATYLEMDKSYTRQKETLREEVEIAERVCDTARGKVEQAKEVFDRAKKDREEIETGKRLHDYIMERSNDSKYKNKLGIVSMIREDFKGLSELVTESQEYDKVVDVRKIERIVLYIDDLDRCPSERVVEVLQAVHLILAFRLFVVVVGVDCRWILHALRKEYSAFGGGGSTFAGSSERWLTTPHNYVEKIFQIPFALEQMDDDGYRGLIKGLTDVTEQVNVVEEIDDGKKPEKAVNGEGPIEGPEDAGIDVGKEVREDKVTPSAKDAKPDDDSKGGREKEEPYEKQAEEGTGMINMKPDELRLEKWEIEFMKELGDFVSSPRATKRFVNVYMLICATLTDEQELAKFKGTKKDRGDYQAVQLMLGILTGFPNLACHVLKAMEDKAGEEKDILEFVNKLKTRKVPKSEPPVYRNVAKSEISGPECRAWNTLHGMLVDNINRLGINTSFEPFSDWAGLVGRFSFQYGRVSERQMDESEEAGRTKKL